MRKIALALAIVMAAPLGVSVDSVRATTTIRVSGAPLFPYAEWVGASQVKTPRAIVTVSQARCPRLAVASSCVPGYGTHMFFNPMVDGDGHYPNGPNRDAFFHELGHVFDGEYLGHGDKIRLRRLLERHPRVHWRGGSFALSPAEQFADAYGYCAVEPQPDPENQFEAHSLLDTHTLRIPRSSEAAICDLIETTARTNTRGDSSHGR